MIQMRKRWKNIVYLSTLLFVFFFTKIIWAEDGFRFVVAGDTRGQETVINNGTIGRFINLAEKLDPKPSSIVFVGDQVLNGGKEELEIFKKAVEPLSLKGIGIYPLIGNHELKIGRRGELDFVKVFDLPRNGPKGYEELVYYVKGPNVLLVILDAYKYKGMWKTKNKIDSEQMQWLKKVLEENPKGYKFVFSHSPAYPVGQHTGSSLDYRPRSRDQFWSILVEEKVSAYFCAHEHIYSKRIIDAEENPAWTIAIPQFIIGTIGAPIQPGQKESSEKFIPTYNFAVVDVYQDKFEVKVYDLDGMLIDHYED